MNVRWMGLVAAAVAMAACDFPPVPRGSGAQVDGAEVLAAPSPESPPLYDIGREPETLAEPLRLGERREVRGKLVGNAVSSWVIEPEDSHSWIKLEATPQTELRIGDQRAGLREIQPGTEVRATFVPVEGANFGFAVEIVADPATQGWRSEPREPRRATEEERSLPEAN
ncbi:hypothetical protein [Vulgatibacter sp.]|uniref:hypothetical protein n=1 Tax=Vulgatibacter sp. TaxID=1971226 RepID=UPI0035698BA1